MSELAKRVAFAAAAIPVVVAAVWFGDAPLAALLSIVAAIGAWEFFRIGREGGAAPLAAAGIVLAAVVPLWVHGRHRGVGEHWIAPAAVAVVALLGASVWTRGVEGRPLSSVAETVFGVLYTGGMLSFGYALRYHPYVVGNGAGTALVFFPVLLTWATDTGAYVVGRAFGKRKLIPAVSPGKTVAGAFGALAVSVVVAWVYARWILRPAAQLGMAPWTIVAFALAVSVAGQVGDLAESLLKREAGVKDSSRIIPGHGGVLDRVDSLLFALPVAYLLLGYFLLPVPG